jgi:outer membrane protein insertion porin family
MIRYVGYTLVVFIVVGTMLFAQKSIDLSLQPTADETFALLDDYIKEPFFLEKLSFESDITISVKELAYLTGLKEKTAVTKEDLKRACWHLKRKSKFDTVTVTLVPSGQGMHLTLFLRSIWTFFKVKVKGSLVGKDRYQHYYAMEPGEPFDLAKHQHSLVKIQEELKRHGYLQAKVADHIAYDKNMKRVLVTLYLENAEQFLIEKVALILKVHQTQPMSAKTDSSTKLQEHVQALLDQLKGQYYDHALIDRQVEEIKSYLIGKGYLNPKIELSKESAKVKKTVALTCTVTVYQKKRFVFFGNHFYSSEQLLEELLLIGKSAMLIPPGLLAEDISALYKKKGFLKVSVDWREEPDRFYFLIKEGPRIRVSKVRIKGNIPTMRSVDQKLFDELLKLPFFDVEVLNQALEALGTAYIKEGFWDFKVVKQDFTPLGDMLYELVLTIDPGQRRLLTGVTIEGFPDLEHEGPFAEWEHLEVPRPFDVHSVQEQRAWLLKHFKQKGALYVSVKPELVPQKGGTQLVWHIAHAQEVHFGKTVLAGVNSIKPGIILREIQYKEGEPWNKEKIEQTVKRLKALNMFESVSLAPYNITTAEGTKTMLLKVVEDDPFELRTRLGFQQMSTTFTNLSGTTYRLGGSFLWKNPCGIADQFRLDADLTRYTRNLAFSYEIPWTLWCPIRSLYQVYSDRYEQPIGGKSRERLYRESHDGFSLGLSHAYMRGQVNLTAGFEISKLSGLSEKLAKVIQFEPTLIDKREPYLYFESSWLWDTFDNKLDPTKGALTSLSLRGMFPLRVKHGYFIKVLLEQSFIYPLYKSVIGALRFRVGHIFNEQFSTLMPTERFYLGGATSLRGYETDMVPPLNSFVTAKHECSWVPVGGKSMVNINAEVRFPVYKWLSGVIFTDMGVLAQNKWADIQAQSWVGATGIGLRCATPIGPIRFDIGWKWRKRDPQDKSYAWFLTLGHAF